MVAVTKQATVKMTPDPLSSALRIEIEIPEVYAADHYFALRDFERIFMGYRVPMSKRLRALADFIQRTQE
jgi:hypothetical protein